MTTGPGLRRFLPRQGPAALAALDRPRRPLGETCELCGVDVPDEHPHVVNIETRNLRCTCRPCYLLFTQRGAGRGAYLAVPDRYLTDPGSELTDARWDELQVPVSVAFFFHNSQLGRIVAQYPSPAGATESLLDLSAWDAVAREVPLAAELSPDVEALVVRRTQQGNEAYLVPVDVCYELVGRMRLHWTGFDGGPDARHDLDAFFAGVRARSRPLVTASGASHG